MYKKIFNRRSTHLFFSIAGTLTALATASNCAIAQEQQLAQITVTAPREVHKVVGKSTAGVPIESISLSYQVTFSDLDLTRPAGVSELERRIDTMAKAACVDLDKLYPRKPSDQHCVTRAIASAADQKKQAIASAVAK